jgi:hypothetical protein
MARVVFHPGAFYKLRSEPGVRRDISHRTNRIAEAANSAAGLQDGYRASSQQGARRPQGRWRGTVITATAEAVQDNARHNRLLRSLHAGRG